ncbi:MAG: hypothetical protein R3C53_13640 [Pirellulaceae bacterium]
MLRCGLALTLFLLSSAPVSLAQQYTASGRFECEDSPGSSTCAGSCDGTSCDAAHTQNMANLQPSAPSCQFDPTQPAEPAIYVDEGCISTMGGGGESPPGTGPYLVKVVYTFANGMRVGAERRGQTQAAATSAADTVTGLWESRQVPGQPAGTKFGARDMNSKKVTVEQTMDMSAPPMALQAVPQMQDVPDRIELRTPQLAPAIEPHAYVYPADPNYNMGSMQYAPVPYSTAPLYYGQPMGGVPMYGHTAMNYGVPCPALHSPVLPGSPAVCMPSYCVPQPCVPNRCVSRCSQPAVPCTPCRPRCRIFGRR